MILEALLLKNTKAIEKFQDASENTDTAALKYSTNTLIILLVIILAAAIFYTGGAISLSVNYNNYIGTSTGLKILYGILVFLFPSLYYPVYAWFLSPVKGMKSMPRI